MRKNPSFTHPTPSTVQCVLCRRAPRPHEPRPAAGARALATPTAVEAATGPLLGTAAQRGAFARHRRQYEYTRRSARASGPRVRACCQRLRCWTGRIAWMVVLALVVQDEAGTNIYLGHLSVLPSQVAFRLSQLVHARLQRMANSAEADRGALVVPGELAAYRTQYCRVHEATVLAVTFASAARFDGSGCLTNAAQVLLSACRSQRSQTVTVRELVNKRERLAEELEKCLYGEKGLGAKHENRSRNYQEVKKGTEADESLRRQLETVDFSLPESLLSVARKQNVPPQTPSRKSARDLWTLAEDHFVPSLDMPTSSVGRHSSSHGDGEGHSHSETHTNPDASDAQSEISWGSGTTVSQAAGSGAPRPRSPGRILSEGIHGATSRNVTASASSEGVHGRSGSTAASELSYITAPRANPAAEVGQLDQDTQRTASSASSADGRYGSPAQQPPPPTPPQATVRDPPQKSSQVQDLSSSKSGMGVPEPALLRLGQQFQLEAHAGHGSRMRPEPEPEPEPEFDVGLNSQPTSPLNMHVPTQTAPRCQLKLVERVAAVLVNGQPTEKFSVSGQIAATFGADEANTERARLSLRLWNAQNIAGETLQWGPAATEDLSQPGVFHCDLPPQPSTGSATVLLSYKATNSYRMVPLSVRAKWDDFKQERIVTIDLRANPGLLQPVRKLRVGAQLGGAAPISRSIPADVSVSLGPGRWLLAKLDELKPGGSAVIKIGFKGQGPDGKALELPQPATIMVVFESVGTLSGLQLTASLRRGGSTADVPSAASFEAMPKWYQCRDSCHDG